MNRIKYIDNIKIFLAFLVVLFHTSSAYGGAVGWYFVEPPEELVSQDVLTLINVICQSFFMGFFFFISAYFIPQSILSKGKKKFFIDRFVRLVIPALLYCFILNPTCVNVFEKKKYIESIGFYNLWFPMALFYFTLAYIVITSFTKIKLPKMNFPNKKNIFIFIFCIGIINFIVRMIFKVDHMYFSDFTLGFFPQYIALFFMGIAAYKNKWLNNIKEELVKYFFRLSIISIILLPVIFDIQMNVAGNIEDFYGGFNIASFLYCIWEPVVFVGVILKILYLFKTKLNCSNSISKTAARCSYFIYIIQSPIIIILVIAFRSLDINIILKTLLVTIGTFIISLIISNFILKIKVLKKIF